MNRALVVVLAAIFGIAAIGCGSSKPAALTVITVSGVVTTAAGPVASAKVKINDRPVVTTALDGSFTVNEVTVPYDALVGYIDTGSGAKRALLYKGLTRPDPDLNFEDLGNVPPGHKAQITGTLSGSFPAPAGSCTLLTFGSSNFKVPLSTNYTSVDSTSGAYSIDKVTWRGNSPLVGTAYALQFTLGASANPPTAFTYHGSLPVSVADSGAPVANFDLSLVSGSNGVTGSVSVPSGYNINSRWFEVYLEPDYARIPIFMERVADADPCGNLNANPFATNCHDLCKYLGPAPATISNNFAFLVPTVNGTTAVVWVNAIKGTNPLVFSQVRQCDILPGTVGVNLALPLPPAQDSPPDGADPIGVGTRFSWSAFPDGGIHGLLFTEDPLPIPTLEPVLTVYTAGTEVILPDLAPVGLSWPAAKTYSWRIAGYAPATVDQWADPIIQLGCNFTQAWADKRTFKTP